MPGIAVLVLDADGAALVSAVGPAFVIGRPRDYAAPNISIPNAYSDVRAFAVGCSLLELLRECGYRVAVLGTSVSGRTLAANHRIEALP